MSNTLIVYTSKYGSTKQYAQWLAEALSCEAKPLASVTTQDLAACETVLYGGGLYVGRVSGFQKFLKKLPQNGQQRLVLFMVGSTNPELQARYDEIAKQNIPAEWQPRFQAFGLRGDQKFSQMSWIHSIMMRMPKAMMERKPPEERTEDDRHFLENYGKDIAYASQEAIGPIVDYLQNA